MPIAMESAGKDRGSCEIYKDAEGKWRWRAIAKNGQIVAASHQGYVNKSDCLANAKSQGYEHCSVNNRGQTTVS